MAQPVAQAAKTTIRKFRELHGVVVSAGLMDKTVKVRVGGQKWDSFLKKVGPLLLLLLLLLSSSPRPSSPSTMHTIDSSRDAATRMWMC